MGPCGSSFSDFAVSLPSEGCGAPAAPTPGTSWGASPEGRKAPKDDKGSHNLACSTATTDIQEVPRTSPDSGPSPVGSPRAKEDIHEA